MKNNDVSLAIVVPAYKSAFLEESLKSLLVQVDENAKVYVFDDASPENIESISRKFGDSLVYRRFDTNLGGSDLAGQWNRCIDETKEDWIWLFSDDDIADSGCLAAFREQSEPAGLYRFDTKVVDENSHTVEYNIPHPEHENCLDYAYYRFRRKRSTTAVEYIFSRADYSRTGKFDSIPLAWGSDVMMWIKLGKEAGIKTLSGPVVGWRRSELNLSPDSTRNVEKKISGSVMFFEWTRDFFQNAYCDNPKQPLLMKALNAWISDYILNQAAYQTLTKGIRTLKTHGEYLGLSPGVKTFVKMFLKRVSKKVKRKLG